MIVSQDGVEGKVCRVCEEWKPLNQFKGNGKSSDKHDHKCRACRKWPLIKHSFENGIEGKVCAKCKRWYPLTNFSVDNCHSDGLHSYCFSCMATRSRNSWESDKAQWNKRNIESYYRHRETRLVSARQYRANNIEIVREKERKRSKARYKGRSEVLRVYRQNRRAAVTNAPGTFTEEEWMQLKERYEYTCLCCKRREPDIQLTVDHVIPLSRGGANSIDNIQPLCLTCNLSKSVKSTDYR